MREEEESQHQEQQWPTNWQVMTMESRPGVLRCVKSHNETYQPPSGLLLATIIALFPLWKKNHAGWKTGPGLSLSSAGEGGDGEEALLQRWFVYQKSSKRHSVEFSVTIRKNSEDCQSLCDYIKKCFGKFESGEISDSLKVISSSQLQPADTHPNEWKAASEHGDVEVREGGRDNELEGRREQTDGGNGEWNRKTNDGVRENEEMTKGGSQLENGRNDPHSTDGSPQPISTFLTEDRNKSKNESDDEDELDAVRPILDGKHIFSQGYGCTISRVSPDVVVQCLHISENQMIRNNANLHMRLMKYKSYESKFMSAMSLAESGFIPFDQESSTDAVVCVWCGLTLKDFKEHVDAIAIHQTYSYDCQYLRQLAAKEREGPWQLANYDMVLEKPAVRSAAAEDDSSSFLTTSVQSTTSLVPDVTRLQDMSDMERYKFFLEDRSVSGVPNADDLMSKWKRSSQSYPYFDDSSAAILKAHGITWKGEHLLCTQCPFHIDLNQQSPMESVDDVLTRHAERRNDNDQPCQRSRGINCDSEQVEAIGMLQLLGVNTHFSKHSEFSVTDRRLATFLTYPYGNGHSHDELAEAGYFYSGDGDGVTCFSCGIVSSNWLTAEVPWQRHARSSPSCQYLAGIKGADFVSQVIEQMGSYTTEEPENRINTITTRMLRPRMESPAVQGALARGLERSKVRDVISKRIRRGETDFRFTADIVKAVHDLDVPSTAHINQPNLPSHELLDVNEADVAKSNKKIEWKGSPPRHPFYDDFSAAILEAHGLKWKDKHLWCEDCSVYLDLNKLSEMVPVDVVITKHAEQTNDKGQKGLERNHELPVREGRNTTEQREGRAEAAADACCIACAAAMVQCPLCRNNINGTIKVNMPQE